MPVASSVHTHPHVHYWANGVAQLINANESSWLLAKVLKHTDYLSQTEGLRSMQLN